MRGGNLALGRTLQLIDIGASKLYNQVWLLLEIHGYLQTPLLFSPKEISDAINNRVPLFLTLKGCFEYIKEITLDW